MTSIEWTKITPQMKVVETKTHFEAAGKLVTWGSRDAKTAQMWLTRRARADAKGTEKSVPMKSQHWFKMAVANGKKTCKNCSSRSYCPLVGKPFLGTCGSKVTQK